MPSSSRSTSPPCRTGEWARVAVTVGGICGSDLHLFGNRPMQAPALGRSGRSRSCSVTRSRARVIEAGADCDVPVGTRVAVDPVIPSAVHGIDPVCRSARPASRRAASTSGVGSRRRECRSASRSGSAAGWADQVLAHRSMLHPIPDAVPDSIASLHEPVSVAVHGLLRKPPRRRPRGDRRGRDHRARRGRDGPRRCSRRARSRSPRATSYQGDAARAPARITSSPRGTTAVTSTSSPRSRRCGTGRGRNRMLLGGFPYVIEAVGGLESVTESLRARRPLGHGAVHRHGRCGRGRPQSAVVQGGRVGRGVEPLARRAPVARRRGTRSTSRSTCSHEADFPSRSSRTAFALEDLRDAVRRRSTSANTRDQGRLRARSAAELEPGADPEGRTVVARL